MLTAFVIAVVAGLPVSLLYWLIRRRQKADYPFLLAYRWSVLWLFALQIAALVVGMLAG